MDLCRPEEKTISMTFVGAFNSVEWKGPLFYLHVNVPTWFGFWVSKGESVIINFIYITIVLLQPIA